ncbi:prephenate dehydrogenase/arogenate dehydrogenase family protein [Pelistega europaea]|uniref:prephenate dehydrogenase n=1 Tax=Pelistega europaea TaxID=106147 RepID=A0A7Y4P6Z2_9BURK|nr:prephenate dehydrogenase/arogenate dehydrogenase family protein [Pelistega europaea]
MKTARIKTLGIIGVGLIGGSFALNLKHYGLVDCVLGAGRDTSSIVKALELGIIDRIASIDEIAQKADVIVVATPVNAFAKVLQQLMPKLSKQAIVSDVGSTKANVIQAAREVMGNRIGQFVPAHPIAGSHASGPTAAFLELFQEKNVIITPLVENKPEDVALMTALWQACGAHVQLLAEAKDHDDIFAGVSHFPHFLAACYMSFMESDPVRRQALKMGGTGFRDFTRIAAGSPEMWRDIFLSNREAMLHQMDEFEKELVHFKHMLELADGEQIYDWLAKAAEARRTWKTVQS